jgi:hypothetical protein
MEALKLLSKYHIEDKSNKVLDNYTWANTPDRTNFNLKQSTERFNTTELIHAISSMLSNGLIKENFTILDLFGGTGAVTYIIKKNFPKCIPICIDLKHHSSWEEILKKYPNFNFFQIDFFELEKEQKPLNLDILITFNTFRGWDNSVGPFVHQNHTKFQFCNWVKNNAKYFITDRGDVENYFELLPFDSSFNNLKVAYSK